ncbi:interferon gamma related precursor [Cyprinus carpio]|uniref:Interferon gamma related precursor n=2 Tax=Cyprinus carpio TaxID=7962 RepID=B6GV48_CYPCA|nr:interferon gamma related precursor [Cyprinus carpio]CAJ98867.1 putative interferon gamma 1 [Cyprinus carpio]
MYCWLNMVHLICALLLIVSLQGTVGARLPQSQNDKEQMLKNLREKIEPLQKHYHTTDKEWFGKSVLLSHLHQLNSKASCTCQSLLLDRMLNITETILQDLRGKAENEETKTRLTDVMTEVKILRHKYSEEQKVWRELQDIHSVEVKNGTNQKGALNSFLILYDLAY